MKTTALAIILMALTPSLCLAAAGQPENNGLTPVTGTFYANTNHQNNGAAESDTIDIASNGNVIIGWEDDGGNIFDFESCWSVFDFNGNLLTPATTISNRSLLGAVSVYKVITNTYLSYFRSDGTAIGAYTGFAPKIKANKWGNGFGHGSSDWEAGLEIDELFPLNNAENFDDMPLVQLLNNDGTPYIPGPISYGINGVTNLGILTMGAAITNAGNCRIADWDYLSNGNIVIGGESRQAADRLLTGQTAGNVPVFRIVKPSGEEVVPYTAASADASNNNDMWHGVGVTANGFAMRWNKAIRMFDNSGNPVTTNLDLVTLTGQPDANVGDRGENIGFHGNGRDAYVFVDRGNYTTTLVTNPGPPVVVTAYYTVTRVPWVTVLNTNGTVRWSRAVRDPSDPWSNVPPSNALGQRPNTEVDAAIAPDGRVLVVFTASETNTDNANYIVNVPEAMMISPCGTTMGSRFFVSEWDNPTNATQIIDTDDVTPRVAWRGNRVAFSWMSANPAGGAPLGIPPVVGVRTMTVNAAAPPTNLAIAQSGNNVVISWSGGGTLESADNIAGPWTPIYDCSPVTQAIGNGTKIYRVKGW